MYAKFLLSVIMVHQHVTCYDYELLYDLKESWHFTVLKLMQMCNLFSPLHEVCAVIRRPLIDSGHGYCRK